MGKGLLYSGLAILVLGQGPWLIFGPEHREYPSNLTELLLFGLSMVSILPGIVLTLLGALACFHSFLKDRLPY